MTCRVLKVKIKGIFSQDTTRCIPAFRDTSDLCPCFSLDPLTQSDTFNSYNTGTSALLDMYTRGS